MEVYVSSSKPRDLPYGDNQRVNRTPDDVVFQRLLAVMRRNDEQREPANHPIVSWSQTIDDEDEQ